MIVAVAVALALSAPEPSFECAKATTAVERLICGDESLAHADRAVAQAYRGAKARNVKGVLVSQKEWLARRNECKNRYCIVSSYDDQLFYLLPDSHLGR